MESLGSEFAKILEEYVVSTEGVQDTGAINQEQAKKLRKKLKKSVVDPSEDTLPTSYQKLQRIIEALNKSYEGAVKAKTIFDITKENKEGLVGELNKELNHKKMLEQLHSDFMKKYNEELKSAQNYEAEETENKKKYTEELQKRIKDIQDRFEESGKRKIQSIRNNEIAKEELSRLNSHLQASEALVDTQLKKKGLEIDIQMSTLKQKVEMIQELKNHGSEYGQKLQKAKEDQAKIVARVQVFEKKEEEHKMALTKAHVLIEEYKACVFEIRDTLQKNTKQSETLNQKVRKSEDALKTLRAQDSRLRADLIVQNGQLQGLKNLQNSLKEQLKNL